MMPDYRSMYGKEWLGAWDFERDVTLTITDVTAAELVASGGRKSKRPAVSFKGTDKRLALNATNGKAIAGMYGTKTEAWIGKRITLFKTMTRKPDGDGEVECIRVRPSIPPTKTTVTEITETDTGSTDG